MSEAAKRYYAEHREQIRERQRQYYLRKKEWFAERCRAWRESNPDKVKAYRSATAARRREIALEWKQENREHLAEYMRAYRKKDPERFAGYEANRSRPDGWQQKFNQYHRGWCQKNAAKRQAYYQARRARLAGAGGSLSPEEIEAQRKRQRGKCHYCTGPLDNHGRGHVDHRTPLVRGGMNSAENIVIACASCNLRKARRTEEEFLPLIRGQRRAHS